TKSPRPTQARPPSDARSVIYPAPEQHSLRAEASSKSLGRSMNPSGCATRSRCSTWRRPRTSMSTTPNSYEDDSNGVTVNAGRARRDGKVARRNAEDAQRTLGADEADEGEVRRHTSDLARSFKHTPFTKEGHRCRRLHSSRSSS